jgi:hypothetical protein
MGKSPTLSAECLEQLQVGKPGRTSSYHSFPGLPAYNPLAVVLRGSDAISIKQLKMKPDEVLALVTDLKESLEELHKKVEKGRAAQEG